MEPLVLQTLSDKSGSGVDLARRMFSVLFSQDWLATHDPWKYCPDVHETTSEESAARQAGAFSTWPGSYDRLPAIRAPTLVLTGTNDFVIPPANSRLLARCIPHARLVEIPGAGHGVQYQCPEQVACEVTAFLREGEGTLRKSRRTADCVHPVEERT
ncbi:MAG TPA: alpha/beta hydrolase [Methanoregula sp.]|nr:alpha/beta hydrolase [Methanoregula sp.]